MFQLTLKLQKQLDIIVCHEHRLLIFADHFIIFSNLQTLTVLFVVRETTVKLTINLLSTFRVFKFKLLFSSGNCKLIWPTEFSPKGKLDDWPNGQYVMSPGGVSLGSARIKCVFGIWPFSTLTQFLFSAKLGLLTILTTIIFQYTGLWYEYSNYFAFFQLFGKCVTAEYTLQSSYGNNIKIGVINRSINER